MYRRAHCLLLLTWAGLWMFHASLTAAQSARLLAQTESRRCVTNVARFKTIPAADYLDGCDFHLEGIVTLVDTNRNLIVLQDDGGAVALNFRLPETGLHVGQRLALDGTNCSPYLARFPDYPFRPAGRELRNIFEAPTGFGEYYLSRMRGYLHPAVTGEYSFWIASDNSSELWLSVDRSPSKARKIASIPRFSWVAPREWARFPSQHSQPILLEAGKTYYLEALQEQTTVGDNLAVAWQGPGLDRDVIDGRYLTSCNHGPEDSGTNGVTREFWTNYVAGDLTDVGGARPYRSALTVESVGIRFLGEGQLPKPEMLAPGQAWQPDENYHFIATEGAVGFVSSKEDGAWFELAGEQTQVQARTPHLDPAFLQRMHNARVRIEGVCEGVFDKNDNLAPGIIWVAHQNNIHFIENAGTKVESSPVEHPDTNATPAANSAMQGFYSTRGVVTFNDHVLDSDYLIVQEDESAVFVSGGETAFFQKQLRVGDDVELGGALQPGAHLPVISPLVISELGARPLPVPVTARLGAPIPADRNGRWSELDGVVHSANADGTISVMGKDGLVHFWIGESGAADLRHLVDAKLCARGVLLLNVLDTPLLLVPSRSFIDVQEPAPKDPFGAMQRPIGELGSDASDASLHRVHIAGEVTYREGHLLFVQDPSGGIRVRTSDEAPAAVGESLEILGFPAPNGTVASLTESALRPSSQPVRVVPKTLDLSEALSAKQDGTLVRADATLLAVKTNGVSAVLELQEQQRVFAATLARGHGTMPDLARGSRLQVTGVCDNQTAASPLAGDKSLRAQYVASLTILLRSPADVLVVSGPPWWTWKRAAMLVSTLFAVIIGTLLWVHLLRRRLERQQAAQLAFSRQVFERLEDERQRIAINLHDSLGQMLLVIKNHALLAIQRPPDAPALRQRLDDISDATSQAIEEVRQITHGLRPYQLDRLGLTQAIRASIGRASVNSSISFATRVEDIDGFFDKDAEIHVYRIVQEAITNVVKHSGATEAAVVIKKRTPVVAISIRDNGRGFDASKPSSASHELGYGLSGIAERVRILGGILTIDSRPGEGTSLNVEVPLPSSKHERRDISADRG